MVQSLYPKGKNSRNHLIRTQMSPTASLTIQTSETWSRFSYHAVIRLNYCTDCGNWKLLINHHNSSFCETVQDKTTYEKVFLVFNVEVHQKFLTSNTLGAV